MSHLTSVIKELNPRLTIQSRLDGYNTYITFKEYPGFEIREYDSYKAPDVLIYVTSNKESVFYKAINKKEYNKINLYKTAREILSIISGSNQPMKKENRFSKIAQQSAFDPGYQPETTGDITSLIRTLRSHAETLQNLKRQNDWYLSSGYTNKLIKQLNDTLLAAIVYNNQKKMNPQMEKQQPSLNNPTNTTSTPKPETDIQKRIKEIMEK